MLVTDWHYNGVTMDTAYIVLTITLLTTLVTAVLGFMIKQSLADRDRIINNLDSDVDLAWRAISELQRDQAVTSNQMRNQLDQLNKMSRQIEKLGDDL